MVLRWSLNDGGGLWAVPYSLLFEKIFSTRKVEWYSRHQTLLATRRESVGSIPGLNRFEVNPVCKRKNKKPSGGERPRKTIFRLYFFEGFFGYWK